MPPLVLYDEMVEWLDLKPGTDQALLTRLLNGTTKLFEKACGRGTAPFAGPITGRTEIHEGYPGSRKLYLDYPISTVTSISLGQDVALPTETLAPTDPTKVVWTVGSRILIRTDGGVWRSRNYQSWVKVVYNTQADLPEDAKIAVQRRVATLYGHRGKEGYTSVTRGSRSWTIADPVSANQDEYWQEAVSNHTRNWVR